MTRFETLWDAVKVVAGPLWDYEAVPFDEMMERPRHQHLRNKMHRASALLSALSQEAVRDEALEEAARVAELFTEPTILAFYDRPGGPPGNARVAVTGKAHIAPAIRALKREPNNVLAPGERKPGEIAGPRNDTQVRDCASKEQVSNPVEDTNKREPNAAAAVSDLRNERTQMEIAEPAPAAPVAKSEGIANVALPVFSNERRVRNGFRNPERRVAIAASGMKEMVWEIERSIRLAEGLGSDVIIVQVTFLEKLLAKLGQGWVTLSGYSEARARFGGEGIRIEGYVTFIYSASGSKWQAFPFPPPPGASDD